MILTSSIFFFFFFNDTATTEIYTLSLHDALPIYQEPEPRLFSFNNPYGACPRCQGFGNTIDFDLNLVVPDPSKSLDEGAVEPWSKPRYRALFQELKKWARTKSIPANVPWRQLTAEQRRLVLEGDPENDYEGVK